MSSRLFMRFICCSCVLIFTGTVFSSTICLGQKKVKQINIGDKVPDIKLPVIINYKAGSARLSDFKGKLLILDFWSIWCAGCVKALPHLEKIQNEFSGDIMVLPVSFTRSKSEVQSFFQRMKKNGSIINLPSVVYDKKVNDMMNLFPCYGFPMEVWINGDGKLIAISDSFYITAENIQKALKHEDLNLPLAGTYIPKKKVSNGSKEPLDTMGKTLLFSRITAYADTIPQNKSRRFKKIISDKYVKISLFNASIVDLFKASTYGELSGLSLNNLVSIEIPDSLHLFYPKIDTNYASNKKKYTYSYELRVPSDFGAKNALNLMNQEISNYFRITSSIEKRKVVCYVLRQIYQTYSLNSIAKKSLMNYDRIGGEIRLDSSKISDFVSMIASDHIYPIIDETGYKSSIDIDFKMPKDYTLEDINAELKRQNLVLTREIRELDRLVLKRKQFNQKN